MTQHFRWYDNSDLSDVFKFMETLDDNRRDELAHNMLQVVVNECNLDLDSEINKIYANFNYDYKRWYDTKVEIFNSVEIIKNLSKDQQNMVADKIITSILFSNLGCEVNA